MDNYPYGKNLFWIFLNVMLAAASVALLVAVVPLIRLSSTLVSSRVLTVSAEGKTIFSPDVASFSFSVVSEGKDPVALQDENARKMQAAVDFVKSNSVAEKDIKTIRYDLSPRYEYNEKTRRTFISGYTLTQMVFVKVRDISKVGAILAGLTERGVNRIDSVAFDVDDPERYLKDAREEAMRKARVKAEETARLSGARLGKVISISENSSLPAPIYYGGYAAAKSGEAQAVVAPHIQPGSQEITVQMSLVFELK